MLKVLVIGDSCLDVFEYGDCRRMCPEAPVPAFIPIHKKENFGMSMNVSKNLMELGILCDIVTNDSKPIKIRYIDEASNQLIIRVDRNDIISPVKWSKLKEIKYNSYDAVIISDYNKGFLNADQIKFISQSHDLIFMDSKIKIDDWAQNIRYIKINEKEFWDNAKYLTTKYKNNIIVTTGKNGAKLVFTNHENKLIEKKFPIKREHPVRDLTGAGDTFLAALVYGYLTNDFNLDKSIKFANRCAAWAVTQKGVAIVSMDKLENNGYN